MRGYFGIGAEEISKPMNVGALMRTANAFGASFFFTINAHSKVRDLYNADTSRTFKSVPYYPWGSLEEMRLPRGCQLVGIELTDDPKQIIAVRRDVISKGSASGTASALNLAADKPATQSSTYPGSSTSAAGAVDGNTDGYFFHGSVTSTNRESSYVTVLPII